MNGKKKLELHQETLRNLNLRNIGVSHNESDTMSLTLTVCPDTMTCTDRSK